MSNVTVINNLFTTDELELLNKDLRKEKWSFNGFTREENGIIFWYKELIHTRIKMLFYNKITTSIKFNIDILALYANGQAHGQSGIWHPDYPNNSNCKTLVYFPNEWLPEYGGHLMIKKSENDIVSILPEFNKAVLFDSHLDHMGLDPSRHCLIQRESIACKFTPIK